MEMLAEDNRHWFCSPVQPEDCEDYKHDAEVEEGNVPFNYTPIGFLQCYSVEHLLRREGYQVDMA